MAGTRVSEDVRREQILRGAFAVATRDGIGRLTVRAVAGEAAVSHALVLYHFKSRNALVHQLLEWLLANTSVLRVSEDIARFPRVLDRLHALLQQEMSRLSHEPQHTRLFYEFWALGVRDESIRDRISAELERYRAAFREIMEELRVAEPSSFGKVTADGMAAVAVSWIHGCAVQAMIDPAHFDTEEYLAAVRGIVGQLG
ncbi:MAG TPA: TetR family transcriptional regulator C-terminal domain-containing protein [Longimicrobiales bacterium]|nr:TetR family transcriptional regulator C-terminal domain-containing protein [Longimicrobiales bacterium]